MGQAQDVQHSKWTVEYFYFETHDLLLALRSNYKQKNVWGEENVLSISKQQCM